MARERTIGEVATMGGKARWRGIPKEERSQRMRELLRIRWARERVKAVAKRL